VLVAYDRERAAKGAKRGRPARVADTRAAPRDDGNAQRSGGRQIVKFAMNLIAAALSRFVDLLATPLGSIALRGE
jgi:hypothetical protein